MDTVGYGFPERDRRRVVGLWSAGSVLVATAVAALAAGYELGHQSTNPAPSKTVYVGGVAHTWSDALDEGLALKRRDR